MLKHERELIAKLQISQLVTDKPFVDDYYFQMYKRTKENVDPVLKLKGRQSRKWKFSAHQLLAGKEAVSNDRQNDLKRLIESRRTNSRRASNTLSLEGALGSISRTTNKAPRQAISIVASNSDQSFTQSSRLTELAYIEKFYDVVLRLEELFRKKIPEKQEEIDIQYFSINTAKKRLTKLN